LKLSWNRQVAKAKVAKMERCFGKTHPEVISAREIGGYFKMEGWEVRNYAERAGMDLDIPNHVVALIAQMAYNRFKLGPETEHVQFKYGVN
jgi:hypothetical protein